MIARCKRPIRRSVSISVPWSDVLFSADPRLLCSNRGLQGREIGTHENDYHNGANDCAYL